MKNVKILLFMVLLVLFIVLFGGMVVLVPVFAVTNEQLWDDTLFQIKDTAKDTSNYSRNIGINGSPQNSTTSFKIGFGSIFFDGVNDGLTLNNNDGFFTTSINRTAIVWVNLSDDDGFHIIYEERAGRTLINGDTDLRLIADTLENSIECDYSQQGEPVVQAKTTGIQNYPNGNWELWGCGVNFTVNGGGGVDDVFVYLIRNTSVIAFDSGNGYTEKGNLEDKRIGVTSTDSNFYKGGIDHAILLNMSPSTDNFIFLWNNGFGIELKSDAIISKINFTLNTTSLVQNDIINMTANVTDETGLSFCQFITNATGFNNITNVSVSGTNAQCDNEIKITQAIDTIVNFTAIINDTSNNKNQSSIIKQIGDVTAPTISNISIQNDTSYTSSEKVNITAVITDNSGFISNIKVTTRNTATGTDTNNSMSLIDNLENLYQFAQTFGEGTYNVSYVYADDGSANRATGTSNQQFTVSSPPSGNVEASQPSGGGGLPFIPTCLQGQVSFNNKCINASSINQTFKITSLQNIDQLVFITNCYFGQEESEFRTTIKTNKLIASASFEKPQPNFNIKIDKSDLIVTRKLDLKNRISQRIDGGSIRIVSSIGEIARANLAIRAVNACLAIPLSPQKTGDAGFFKSLFLDIREINKINFIVGILVFPLIAVMIIGGIGVYYYRRTKNLIILPQNIKR